MTLYRHSSSTVIILDTPDLLFCTYTVVNLVEQVNARCLFILLDGLPSWPRFILEVSSLDCWDRHRVEGYGYLDLPSSAGGRCFVVCQFGTCVRSHVDMAIVAFVSVAMDYVLNGTY